MSVTQTSIKAGSLPKSGWAVALLAGTILGGVALGTPAYAQQSGGNTVSDAAWRRQPRP